MNERTAAIGRIERIAQDFRALEDLSQRCELITFEPILDGDLPHAFVVRLRLRAVTSVDTNDRPRHANRFTLVVRLPARYPDQPPICSLDGGEGYPAFHPHFTPLRTYPFGQRGGEWVDPQRYDPREGLAALVLRIAKSLRYERGYVRSDVRPANPDAREWYVRWSHSPSAPELFPTDHAPLPTEALRPGALGAAAPEARKSFIVQPRTPAPSDAGAPPPAVAAALPAALADASQPAKRFEVQEVTPRFAPIARPRPMLHHREDLRSDLRTRGPRGHEVYVRLPAMQDVQRHIGWGHVTHANRNEQCGLLLGRLFTDHESGLSYAMVEHAVPGETAQGTAVHVDVDHQTWKAMLDRADRIMEGRPGLAIVGWYHTHPNHLDVFMSEADLRTQARAFGTPWQCAMVLNPHRMRWRVFIGPEGHECAGYVIVDEEPATAPRALAPGLDATVAPPDAAARRDVPERARNSAMDGPAVRRDDESRSAAPDEADDEAGLIERLVSWMRGNRGSLT